METDTIKNIPVPQNFWPIPLDGDHYFLGDGNLQPKVLMPSGHGWLPDLPTGESQYKNGIDPSSCPAGGTLNVVETLGKLQFGAAFQSDLSERYLSIISGMDGHGGNPHLIAEVLRTISGAIPEVFLPFDQTITTLQKYFSPRPITYSLFKVGWHWHNTYDFGHQWLFTGTETIAEKQNLIKTALRFSPIGVSGYAWSLHPDGLYYHDGPDIHWFVIFDYVEDQNGKLQYYLAFDTYSPFVKKIEPNYNFGYAKGYTLNKRLGTDSPDTEPEPCKLQYALYLVNWLISNFKHS